jgi:hypothetical protein
MKKIDDEQHQQQQIKQLNFNQNATFKLINVLQQKQNLYTSSTLKLIYIYGPIRLFNVGYIFLLSVYNDNRTQIKRVEINFNEITNLIDRFTPLQTDPIDDSQANIPQTIPTSCKIYWRYLKPLNIDKNIDYQAFTYMNYAEMPKILQNFFQFQIKHSILNELFQKKKIFFSKVIEKTSKFIELTTELLKLTQIQSLKSFLYQDIIINLYLEMNRILLTSKKLENSTVDQQHYSVELTEIPINKLIVYKSNEELQQIADMTAYTGESVFHENNLLIIPLKSNDLGNNYYFYHNETIYIVQITVIHKLNLNHKLKLLAKLFHRSSGVLTNLWKYIYGDRLKFQLIFISYENRRYVYEKIEKGLFSQTVLSQTNQFMAFEDFKFHLKNYSQAKCFFENIEDL